MHEHNPASPKATPLYVAKYTQEATYLSPEDAIAAASDHMRRNPPSREIASSFGKRIIRTASDDSSLRLHMEGGAALVIRNPGDGRTPTVTALAPDDEPLGQPRLGDEVLLAWSFPQGDPAEQGRERSEAWTWYRREALLRMEGLRLTKVMNLVSDTCLYFDEDGHILSLVSAYAENGRRPILLWSWDEWRGRPAPGGRPSKWP